MSWTLLDTNETFARLIALLRNAKSTVTLVSPYFDLGVDDRIGQEIGHALKRGVRVIVIVRSDARPKHQAWRMSIKAHIDAGLLLYEVDWLHAKIYCSESEGIVSSLNLIRSSVTNSIEIGLHTTYPLALKDLKKRIANDIWRLKREVVLDEASLPESNQPTPESRQPRVARPHGGGKAETTEAKGHCIRCSDRIDLDPAKPYCAEHYRSWARYRNDEYEESFCHGCGDDHPVTMAKPQCRDCYRANL